MNENIENKRVKKRGEIKTPKLSLDEKLNILANIIVDRLFEEQAQGNLNFTTNGKKE
ncbi:MAG: hypothetical protein M1365_00880 [Actinobacteria bacterium]|nr:hypothetical protein [Actinomycetota bacterium]